MALPSAAALVVVWRAADGWRQRAAVLPAALGVAIGAASVPWSTFLFGGIRSRPAFIALDSLAWVVVVACALFALRQRPATHADAPTRDGWPARLAAIALVGVTAAIAIASFASASAVFPHGEWDAWAQWNLRARFFFRGFADGTWQDAFAPVLAWSHPDYPLLVPASVARLWLYAGRETVAAPIALAGMFAALTVAAAGFSVSRTRGAARGCLAAGCILASPSFVRYSASQCADIALGFFMLAAFVMWANAEGSGRPRLWLAAAGLSAGLAAWTKNEGLAFLALFVVLLAAERIWSRGAGGLRDLGPVMLGAAPVVLLVLYFKLALATSSYFVEEQSLAGARASLADMNRVRLIAETMGRELWLTGARTVGVIPFLCVYAAVTGIGARAPFAARAAAPAMLAMLAIYAIAYLVTPKDLAWQLKTSADRLVVQLVPTLVWSVISIAGRRSRTSDRE